MKGKAGIGKVALSRPGVADQDSAAGKGPDHVTLRHASEIRGMNAIDELADMPER